MSKTNADYQRAYRARQKAQHAAYDESKPTIGAIKTDASKRIAELEAEVAHLKRQLAARPIAPAGEMHPVQAIEHHFNSRPFTPVPKR